MIHLNTNFSLDFSHFAFETLVQEFDRVGYLALPDQDVAPYIKLIGEKQQTHVVVVGIGGSSLGTKAIDHFLKNHFTKTKLLHFLESTDPVTLQARLKDIDLDDALFLVISKSGSTIETMAIFKYILSLKSLNTKDFMVITDQNSPLEKFAHLHGLNVLTIPSNVGGRFSVFSAVGLLPLGLVGYDIIELLQGAKKVKEAFFSQQPLYHTLMSKATFYAQHMTHQNINVIFSYAEIFRHFNEWYIQLWGESLGKKQKHSELNVGLTPIGLIGPTDQHSFLQLIVEGQHDKTVTFIKIKDFSNALVIPALTLEGLSDEELLNNIPFSTLINMQAEAIEQQLERLNIPTDTIYLDNVNEESMGALMYYYELLTSLVGVMLNVDPYDQPGVEEGKKILKKNLKKLKSK